LSIGIEKYRVERFIFLREIVLFYSSYSAGKFDKNNNLLYKTNKELLMNYLVFISEDWRF